MTEKIRDKFMRFKKNSDIDNIRKSSKTDIQNIEDNPDKILANIHKKYSNNEKPNKFLLSIDATGSMAPSWEIVKSHITEIMGVMHDVCKNTKYLIKLSAYRDYCDQGDIWESTEWVNHPEQLLSFLQTIRCFGGGDRDEAVECMSSNEFVPRVDLS